MKTYILRFTTKGIKNIDKVTTVDFYNNTISKGKTIYLDKKNIKGIFGINGAGKSAYILAIDIYKAITTKSDYLAQDFIKEKLFKLINKSTKELFLEYVFAVSKEDDNTKIAEILKHTIVITPSYNEFNQRVLCKKEKLERQVGNTINARYEEIYRVENGTFTTDEHLIDKEWFISEYANRLDQSTLSSFAINSLKKLNCDIFDYDSLLWYSFVALFNAMTTSVFIDSEDMYENMLFDDRSVEQNNKIYDLINSFKHYTISFRINGDIVSKDRIDEYKLQVKKLKEFIQILKPNLIDIKVDAKVDGNYYHCNKVLVYNGYEVDEEYESTGIKRIIKMYNCINSAIKGNKAFIDELDANISGVFLDKLFEFFAENGKGQLCFTSHNILSMNILKQYKNSITVFGETGKVVNIVKNGHYQPVNLFYEGFIEDSPFNINSFDFYKSFDMEE